LIGLDKRGRLRVDQPTITGRTCPAPDAYSPSFPSDDCTFVDQFIAHADCRPERSFFLKGLKRRLQILAKSGGIAGFMTYVVLAPTRGVGVFVAVNRLNFLFEGLTSGVRELVADLAPR
jgi:hypothetical protein